MKKRAGKKWIVVVNYLSIESYYSAGDTDQVDKPLYNFLEIVPSINKVRA